ncbi:DNA-directed RNA polymerase subunit omega [Chelativorans sp.]|uniref:DNA-directed RNA polymerase subunit omega n=1 Tax=Chelativorans sp. TaxID=2203393 RepID=UPI00281101EF|nr:DNA-directed RNA polymerase subunit omega [Chelativorans sp.]
MNVFLPFECERFMGNRFLLAVAAAARTRALNRGAEPLVSADGSTNVEIAMREIAAGSWREEELHDLLTGRAQAEDKPDSLPVSDDFAELRGGGKAAAAIASH